MDLISLIPSFGGLLWTIAAFIIALSIIVAVHEYGHYIVGRWCGIRAEVFSIGFGKVLWSRIDRHGTRWQIAALPLGGYVKFLGDANAASAKAGEDFDTLDEDTKRHTMHGAPLWARAATVAAGPVFNFVMSILIFGAIILWRGVASEPLVVDELRPLPFEGIELTQGDQVLAINGQETPALEALGGFVDALPVAATLDYTVLRDGAETTVTGPHPRPPLVGAVTPDSAALEAGLERDDVIISVDGQPIATFGQLREIVGNSNGASLTLGVWRSGETLSLTMTPRRSDLPLSDGGFETRWLIGVTGAMAFAPMTETPGLGQALLYGIDQTYFIIQSSISGLYHMIAGAIDSCNLRGPIGIAETSGAAASQGVLAFIWFIAVLSTAVGLINLFPIPVLDGGHLVFHAYEAIAGKPPSDRALNVLMSIGLVLVLSLMAFGLSNDLLC